MTPSFLYLLRSCVVGSIYSLHWITDDGESGGGVSILLPDLPVSLVLLLSLLSSYHL